MDDILRQTVREILENNPEHNRIDEIEEVTDELMAAFGRRPVRVFVVNHEEYGAYQAFATPDAAEAWIVSQDGSYAWRVIALELRA